MKTIISLRGVSNSGKTTTIRALYSLLLQNGYQQVSSNFNLDGGDFIAVFLHNGKFVGVTSSCDSYDMVHDRLQELVNAKCNVCICACRSYDRNLQVQTQQF